MSFLSSWFGSSNADVGNEVLTAYFNEALNYPEFSFGSYEEWIASLNAKVPNFVDFIGELVNSNVAATTPGQAADRAANLASQSHGQASIPQITQAAGGRGDTVNWVAGVPEIASQTIQETAEYAASKAQDLGTGVMGTINLVKYLPWIIGGVGVIALYAYFSSAGSQSGRGIRAIGEAAAERIRRKK